MVNNAGGIFLGYHFWNPIRIFHVSSTISREFLFIFKKHFLSTGVLKVSAEVSWLDTKSDVSPKS